MSTIFSSLSSLVVLLSLLLVLIISNDFDTNNNGQIRMVNAQAADCADHTGGAVTIDGTACNNYIFGGNYNNLQITATASTNVHGIYFAAGGSCTGCTINIVGITVRNMFFGGEGFVFSGGKITLDAINTQMIVFEGSRFVGNVEVSFKNNIVTFGNNGTAPALHAQNNGMPSIVFGIWSLNNGMQLSAIEIASNTVDAAVTFGASNAPTITWALAIQGRLIRETTDIGDTVAGVAVVRTNTVKCHGCTQGGLRVSFAPTPPSSDASTFGITTRFEVSLNTVNAVPHQSGGHEFAACSVSSCGFTSPAFFVNRNTCNSLANTTSAFATLPAGSSIPFYKIFGLRIAVPPVSLDAFLTFDFIRASECGDISVSNNNVNVQAPAQVAAAVEGLNILGFFAPTVAINSNVIVCNGTRDSRGLVLDPRALDGFSKMHTAWVITTFPLNIGCISTFGSCPMPTMIPKINTNEIHVMGGDGEVQGFFFPPLGVRRQNSPLGAVPLPFIFPLEFMTNTIVVQSKGNFNFTAGIQIGDPLTPNMIGDKTTRNNDITVHCEGTAPLNTNGEEQKHHCVGMAVRQGVNEDQLPNELMNPPFGLKFDLTYLRQVKGFFSDTHHLECSGNFDSCTGLRISIASYCIRYDLTVENFVAVINEIGDSKATSDDGYGHNGILFLRDTVGATANIAFTMSSVNVRVELNLRRISADLFKRTLVRVDASSQVQPASVSITGESHFSINRFFTLNSASQTQVPTFFSHPFPSGASGQVLSITSLYASHIDYCQDGEAYFAENSTVPLYDYRECEPLEKGTYARPIQLNPGQNTATGSRIEVKSHVFRGLMRRRCVGFFSPDLRTSCEGCTLNLGCEGCDNWWVGMENAGNSWTRTYAVNECPTARTLTKSRELTISNSKSKELTIMVPPRPPTATPELTDSDSISHKITESNSLPLTATDSLPGTRTKSVSLTLPNCFPGIKIEAEVTTTNAGSTRAVERENVRVLLRVEPPQKDIALSGMWDVIAVGNVTKEDVSIIDVDGAKPLELVSVALVGVRTIEAIVRAKPGTNAFRDNVAARFKVDPDILKCRFNKTSDLFESLEATEFTRRFAFLPAAGTSAVVGVGVTALYLQSLLMGSSGISFWYAGRRSIGIYDAVSCKTKKDSLITIIDSPLQLELGDGYLGLARGTVIGNGAIAFFFIAIVVGCAIYRSTSTWKPLFSAESMSWAGAPNWYIPVCCILIPGSMQSVVQLMANANGVDIGLSIFFGLGLVIATPLMVASAILPSRKFWNFVKSEEFTERVPNPAYDKDFAKQQKRLIMLQQQNLENGIEDEEMEEMMLLSGIASANKKKKNKKNDTNDIISNSTKPTIKQKPKGILKRMLGASIVYKTLHKHFVNRYGVIFDRNLPALYWITIADVFVSIAGAIAAGFPADRENSPSACRTAIVAHIAIIIVGLFFMALTPFSCPFDNFIILLVYVIGLANAVIAILSDLNDDETLGQGTDAIAFVLLILFCIKIVIDVFRLWKVQWTWQCRRLYYLITRKTPPNLKKRGADGELLEDGDDDNNMRRDGEEAEMRRREEEEEQEIQMIERKKQLQRRTLPPPVAVEPEDLRSERRKRQQQVEPLLEELTSTKIETAGALASSLTPQRTPRSIAGGSAYSAYSPSRNSHLEQKIQKETQKRRDALSFKKKSHQDPASSSVAPSSVAAPPDHLTGNATSPDFGQYASFPSAVFGPSLNVGLPDALNTVVTTPQEYFEHNDKNEDRNKSIHTREFIAEQQKQINNINVVGNTTPRGGTTTSSSPKYNQSLSPQAAAKKRGDVPSSLLQFIRPKNEILDDSNSNNSSNNNNNNSPDEDTNSRQQGNKQKQRERDMVDEYFTPRSNAAAASESGRSRRGGANNNKRRNSQLVAISPKELIANSRNNNNKSNAKEFDENRVDDDDDNDQDDEAWLLKRAKRKKEAIAEQQRILAEQKLIRSGAMSSGRGGGRSMMSQEDKMKLL